MPSWLLSKPALFAGGALALLLVGGLWFKAHDARVKREAIVQEQIRATEEQIARQDSVLQATQDSLEAARLHTDTVRVRTESAVTSYERQRARINLEAPQPTGTPPGTVNVPVAFVRTADSLAVLVPVLISTIALEREASERRIASSDSIRALLETEVRQLKIAVEASAPKVSDKLKYAAIGGAIIYAGTQILGRR